MRRKHYIQSFFFIPIVAMPVGLLSNCNHNKQEEFLELMITQPSDEKTLIQSQKLIDGSTTFLYKGFKYNTEIQNFNINKLTLNAPGFYDYALKQGGFFDISFVNHDALNKTFDVEISLSNVFISTDPIKTTIDFYYDGKEIKSDKPEYCLYLTGESKKAQIYSPTSQKINEKIYSGTFYYLVTGFSYEGIKNIDDLTVEVSETSNTNNSNAEYFCDIANIDRTNRTFDLVFHGVETEDGDIELSIQFKLNSHTVPCTQQNFSFSLEDEHITRDFRKDEWDFVCSTIRKNGMKGLQETYKVKSFIGLRKKIILKDDQEYTVRVIGQSHDPLYNKQTSEGDNAALTFMFDQAITVKDSTDPLTKIWDDSINIWKYLSQKEAKIREWLNNDFISELMPSSISAWIPRVAKKTVLHLTKETEESADYIWLPSLVELGGFVDKKQTELSNEGYCYEYFKNINSNGINPKRYRKTLGGQNNVNYWLRSPSLISIQSNLVYGCLNGSLLSNTDSFLITKQCAVVPCFCL